MRNRFLKFFLIFVVTLGSSISFRFITFPRASALTAPAIVLGSFDATRGANLSFEFGTYFDQARVSLTQQFPEITVSSFQTLTFTTLSNVNILFLSTANANATIGGALTEAEQASLFDFVKSGGCAILLPDNDTYDVDADAVNESLIDMFGMDITGTLPFKVTIFVTNPRQSLVVNGPYGVIGSFTQNFPGGITNVGPYGTAFAANSLGNALVVIPRGAIQQNSGPVIVFSDVNTFVDDGDLGFFSENEPLFWNSIYDCLAYEGNFLPVVSR